MIKCTNLTKKYNNKIALDNLNITIEKGKIIGLLGTNGSGKTTLIKLLNNLLQATSGTIEIDNLKPSIQTKKIISYLPDNTYLDSNQKISEVINLFVDFYEDFDADKAFDLLDKFQIDTNSRLKTLSKGNKEKVQLILVISRKAQYYILDEPIGGVDPASRDMILDLILNNFDKGATLIISTHLISDIEHYLDEAIILSNGKIIEFDNADNLRERYNKSIDGIFREELKCY